MSSISVDIFTYEQLKSWNFKEVENSKKRKTLSFIYGGLTLIGKKVEEGYELLKKSRVDTRTNPTPIERLSATALAYITNGEDLAHYLERWDGIDVKTQDTLFDIARIPPGMEIQPYVNDAIKRIVNYKGEPRNRLSIELESSISAQETDSASAYISGRHPTN
jgi:hypothetical protein